MNPLISIIVPCYNQAQYLDECLQSVVNQTYENWECVIVNDGSKDHTAETAKKWVEIDSRFKYVYKENGGLSSARNAGISISKGEFIFPLDSDDKIDFTLIEKIIKGFQQSDRNQLVICGIKFFGSKNEVYYLPSYDYKVLLLQNCFVASSAFRKNDWIKVGGYDENLKSFEDWDFWIRILSKESIVFKINENLFYYRKHETGSLTNRFGIDKNFYNSLYDAIYNKNKSIYDEEFGNPILAFQENIQLKAFKEKVLKLWIYRLYKLIK